MKYDYLLYTIWTIKLAQSSIPFVLLDTYNDLNPNSSAVFALVDPIAIAVKSTPIFEAQLLTAEGLPNVT